MRRIIIHAKRSALSIYVHDHYVLNIFRTIPDLSTTYSIAPIDAKKKKITNFTFTREKKCLLK